MLESFSNPPIAQHLAGRHPGTDGDHRSDPNRPNPAPGDGERPPRPARKEPGHDIDATSLGRLLSLLADKTRLRILALLGSNEVCVCHIHDSLEVPQPTVSRHLAYLRRAGLVDVRRDGVWMHYQVARALDPGVRSPADAPSPQQNWKD